MTQHNKLLGAQGEETASQYLSHSGFSILERNFRTKLGEIDIIAFKNNMLYCIEVKTRSSVAYGYPHEAINHKKLQKMRLTAELYGQMKRYKGETKLLVIEVVNNECNLIEI